MVRRSRRSEQPIVARLQPTQRDRGDRAADRRRPRGPSDAAAPGRRRRRRPAAGHLRHRRRGGGGRARGAAALRARCRWRTRARDHRGDPRARCCEHARRWRSAAHEETGLGRVRGQGGQEPPGHREDAGPRGPRARSAVTGDHGLTLIEPAPFGVIGAITPCTNPTSTIICNAIGMLAAGNAVVFNVHPSAKALLDRRPSALLNQAIAGGRRTAQRRDLRLPNPTIETAQELMRHPGVRLLVVTGGGAVVKAAMASRQARDLRRARQPAGGGRRDRRPRARPAATSCSAPPPTTTSSASTRRRCIVRRRGRRRADQGDDAGTARCCSARSQLPPLEKLIFAEHARARARHGPHQPAT